jgi:hypothetical protein
MASAAEAFCDVAMVYRSRGRAIFDVRDTSKEDDATQQPFIVRLSMSRDLSRPKQNPKPRFRILSSSALPEVELTVATDTEGSEGRIRLRMIKPSLHTSFSTSQTTREQCKCRAGTRSSSE